MIELLDSLIQLAKERARTLQENAQCPGSKTDGFVFVAQEWCSFVRSLVLNWGVVRGQLEKGIVPSEKLLHTCDSLHELCTVAQQQLAMIMRLWSEGNRPNHTAPPVYQEVLGAQNQVENLLDDVKRMREQAVQPTKIVNG